MADWRNLNSVPDSEDEEESLAYDSNSSLERETRRHDEKSYCEEVEEHAEKKKRQSIAVVIPKTRVGKIGDHDPPKAIARPSKNARAEIFEAIAIRSYDEDDDIDELQKGHFAGTPNVKPDNELNGRASGQGLAPERTSSEEQTLIRSNTSSPLSSIGLSDEQMAELISPSSPSLNLGSSVPLHQIGLERSSCLSFPVVERVGTAEPSHPAQRSFRERKLIQLHPYAIESERYKQSLKARGLQPLHIAQKETQEDDPEAFGEEEQDSYTSPDRGNRISSSGPLDMPSSPPQTFVQSSSPRGLQETSSVVDDEEFPDLSSLLRRPLPHAVRNGFKRAKTSHTYSKQDRHSQISPTSNRMFPSPRHRKVPREGGSLNLFDVPPSPPTSTPRPSSSDAIVPPKQHFRMPQKPSTPHLQTPATSSEPRHSRVSPRHNAEASHTYSSDSDLAGPWYRRTHRAIANNELDQHRAQRDTLEQERQLLASSGSLEEEEQLYKVQRKIRGVLPASWLRLDMQNGTKKVQNRRVDGEPEPPESPERTHNLRGVARPVLRLQHRDGSNAKKSPIPISDESSSERDNGSETRQQLPRKRQESDFGDILGVERDGLDWPDLEFMEDDRIDPMLQPATRATAKFKRPKARQTTLTFGGSAPRVKKGDDTMKRSQANPGHPKRLESVRSRSNSSNQVRKARASKLRLGILDVTVAQPRVNQPAFVKVAARSARSRRDLGQGSPSKKFLRLATREDTADVEATLSSWKNGSLAQRHQPPIRVLDTRIPLKRTSGNRRPSDHFREYDRRREPLEPSLSEAGFNDDYSTSKENYVEKTIQSILDRQRSQGLKKPQFKVCVSKLLPKVSRAQPRHAHIRSSINSTNSARPALLEVLATRGDHAPVGPSSYKTPRPLINTAIYPRTNPILDRFLQDSILDNANESIEGADNDPNQRLVPDLHARPSPQKRSGGCKRQKQRPRQLDIRKFGNQKILEVDTDDSDVAGIAQVVEQEASTKSTLFGLGPHGTDYTLEFDIEAQLTNTGFCNLLANCKEGSANLEELKQRDLQKPVDTIKLTCFRQNREWNAWTETVSCELSETIKDIISAIRLHREDEISVRQHNDPFEAVTALDFISTFLAKALYFLDPVDRISCVEHLLALTKTLIFELTDQVYGFSRDKRGPAVQQRKLLRIVSTKIVVLGSQIHVISTHETVHVDVQDEARRLVEQAFRLSMEYTLFPSLKETWLFLRQSDDLTLPCQEDSQAACISLLLHIALKSNLVQMFYQGIFKSFLEPKTPQQKDIRVLERTWRDIFTLLPFLQKLSSNQDENGLGSEHYVQNWALIRHIVVPVIESYIPNSRKEAATFSSYLHAILGRCLKLTWQWNWRRPETIIGILFDFFARNNLGNLQHERSRGSPQFLQQLQDNTTFNLSQLDSCFHVYLKLLASGLRSMHQDYPPKKIRDIAWRYMPNHGRNLPKDQSIRQEDLEALRNHHDLLSVLYWASPPDFRPRLTAIQNLVHIETSHREACHISIRTWSNLVRYQLSTDEPLAKLDPFARWISDILHHVLHLHKLARSEVEAQVKAAELCGSGTISIDDQEMMISRNQRQVEAVLEDAVVSLKNAIESARTSPAAQVIFPNSLYSILELFDVKHPRTSRVTIQALEVYLAFVQKILSEPRELESQDFGDWTAFDDELSTAYHGPTSAFLEETLLGPTHQLLSNILGADGLLDEGLLTKTVETWTAVAHLLVSHNTKSWNDFLGPYGSHSWKSFRDTEQTRKYTPYVLAHLIRKDKEIPKEHEESIQKVWLASCLERDSLLIFQHLLTGAILDHSHANPLLNHLRSLNEGRSERFTDSISEFRTNRGDLLSSVLANMRETLDFRAYHELEDRGKLKQDYVDLLKHMMSTMKANYRDLGPSSNLKGAYVDFVHMVVGLLQRYTADICPIDRFFVDSSDFPAPATDPAYVVDRILNYVHRFGDGKSPKQLASLLQNLCERAIVDDKVEDLVDQFESALHLNGRDEYTTKETLLNFMIHTILPVYVEVASTIPCGWLVVRPLLLAMRWVFTTLVSWIDISSEENMEKMGQIISEYLKTIYRNAIHWIIDHRGTPGDYPLPARAFGDCLQTITALLPMLNYLYQRWPRSDPLADARNTFLKVKFMFRNYKRACYPDNEDQPEFSPPAEDANSRPQYDHVSAFAMRELKSVLSIRWQERVYQNGDIYTRSKHGEWVKVANGYSQDTDTFLEDFWEFNRVLVGLKGMHDDEDDEDEDFGKAKEPEKNWNWTDEVPCF